MSNSWEQDSDLPWMRPVRDGGASHGGPAASSGVLNPFDTAEPANPFESSSLGDAYDHSSGNPFDDAPAPGDVNPFDAGEAAGGFDPSQFGDIASSFEEDRLSLEEASRHSGAQGAQLLRESAEARPDHDGASFGGAVAAKKSPRKVSMPPLPKGAMLMGAAAAIVLGGGGFAATQMMGGDSTNPQVSASTPAAYKLTMTPPQGVASTASWAKKSTIASNVAVRNKTVAYVAVSGSMVILDQDGKQLASSPPTGLTDKASVGVVTIGDKDVVVANGDGKALMWDVSSLTANGDPRDTGLPDGTTLSWNGGGVLAKNGAKMWVLAPDLTFKPVTLPSGLSAMAATANGDVVAGKAGQAWKLIPATGSAREVSPQKPSGLVGDMNAAWVSNGVLVAWGPTSSPNTRVVAFYDASTGQIKAQTKASTDVVNQGLKLTVNPQGTRASAGPILADLTKGTLVEVSGWDTFSSDAATLYGQANGQAQAWSGSGQPVALPSEGASIPWGSTANGRVIAVDVDGTGQQHIVSLTNGGTDT